MSEKTTKPKRSLLTTVIVSALFSFLFVACWVIFNWVTLGFNQTAQKLALLTAKNNEIVRHIPGSIWTNLSSHWTNQQNFHQARRQMQTLGQTGRDVSQDVIAAASDFMPDLSENTARIGSGFDKAWSQLSEKLYEGMVLLKLSTALVLVKLMILFAAIPLFVLLGAVGLVDGLSLREIRTAELGRESSYIFHQLNKWVFHLVFLMLFIWLAMPVSVEPHWVLMPLSLLFAFMLSLTASRFKKHL